MVSVPADTPVTMPPVLIVAMALLLVLHVPPVVPSVMVVVADVHKVVAPLMLPALGNGLTVTVADCPVIPELYAPDTM